MKRIEIWFDKPFFVGVNVHIKRRGNTKIVGPLLKAYKRHNLVTENNGDWLTFHFGFGLLETIQYEGK